MKPIPLIAYLIENSSKRGDSVLDLFGGSGSTLIASEQTGRKCLTMEYDEKYATVIIKRYENLTGIKGELVNERVL
jgi:site-specific DNA-methyltransferase (adenine-specific)